MTNICALCDHKITLTRNGVFRAHGHPARRCDGSGRTPADAVALIFGRKPLKEPIR